MSREKMNNKKFRMIVLPIIAVLIILAIAVSVAATTYSSALDIQFGRGERHTVVIGDKLPDWATEYYEVNNPQTKDGLGDVNDPITQAENNSRNQAAETALEIAREGITLLKNDGVLPLAKGSKVTPFGYRYVQPIWAGTGASSTNMEFDYVVKPDQALSANLSINTTVANIIKNCKSDTGVENLVNISYDAAAFDEKYVFNTTKYDAAKGYDTGTDMMIHELDPKIYKGSEASCGGTTGIVFLGRLGMEGSDLYGRAYEDGTPHEMALTTVEKEMLAYAKTNCDKVVVVCNFNNIVSIPELKSDNGVNAVLWLGSPGAKGLQAMAEILVGDVNPSGRTVDTWNADQSYDPSFVNIEPGAFTNTVSKAYYEYEEDMYVGYRYFETAYAEAQAGNYSGFDYDKQVVYPFGYGLHFDNDKITQTLAGVRLAGDEFTVTGTIKNESGRDVAETVQIYYGAPYYKEGSKIEKPAKNLVAFDKVAVKAGGSADFKITFPKEDIASYDDKCYYSANGSYVIEKGGYNFYLGKNAHESWGTDTVNINETTAYTDGVVKNGAKAVGKRPSDESVAENRFPEINKYIADGNMTRMSRDAFKGTWPTKQGTKDAPAYIVAANANFDTLNDAVCGVRNKDALLYRSEKPVSGQDNGMALSSLRGLAYDDPLWDKLLEQIDFGDTAAISALITYALYCTQKYDPIGLMPTVDVDGPLGITATWSGTKGHVVACAWPSEPIIAATFNVDLAEKMGLAIGQEALTNGVTGWYGPAANLHRSQFGGRNFEYYSEDPVLSGLIMAGEVAGARTNGLIAHLKHFALNEMDRSRGNVQIYASEQAMRELYLKPFELCTKYAEYEEKVYDGVAGELKTVTMKATGAYMTSMTFIGPKFSGNSYTLLTTVLRDEWGFEGFVITDFTSGDNKHKDCGYRVGNDLWLGSKAAALNDLDTATAQWCARKAIHNIAFAYVNSNAFNGVQPGSYAYYDMSPWMIALIVFDVAAGVIVLAGIVWVVLRALAEKKDPDKFRK